MIARRAADLRGFHFGQVTSNESGRGEHGEIVLYIQCAWRLEGPDGIVTGRSDLWEPAESSERIDLDTWDYEQQSPGSQVIRIADPDGNELLLPLDEANDPERRT